MVTRPVITVYEVKVQLQGRPTIVGNLFKEKSYYFKTLEEAESFKKHRIKREKDRSAAVTEKMALEENGGCIVIRRTEDSNLDVSVREFIRHARSFSSSLSFTGYHNRIVSVTYDMMRSATNFNKFPDKIFPDEISLSNATIDPKAIFLLVQRTSIYQVEPEAVKAFTDASELVMRAKIEALLDKISKIKNSIKDASSKIETKKLELKQAKEEIAEFTKSEIGVKFVKEYTASLAPLVLNEASNDRVNESSSDDTDDVNEEVPKPRM